MIRKLLVVLIVATTLHAADVLTFGYDNARTKANNAETVLTQTNVSHIERLGAYTVDGNVQAQPLIISGVGGVGGRTLMIVVTSGNSVYAFDANIPGSTYIWKNNIDTPPAPAALQIGCMATPAVNAAKTVVYAACVAANGDWYLYALNLTDGTTFHSRVLISTTFGGVTPVQTHHKIRGGLLYLNGIVYLTMASGGDESLSAYLPFYGFIYGFDATTLGLTYKYCTTCGGSYGGGGLWWGLAADSSNRIYGVTGNGDFNGTTQWAMSFLRFDTSLTLQDFSTPSDWSAMSAADLDLGSSRATLLGDNYLFGAGKDGRMWLLHAPSLGGFQGVGAGPAQVFTPTYKTRFDDYVFTGTDLIYGGNTHFARIPWTGTSLDNTNAVISPAGVAAQFGNGIAYSSNGNAAGTGIVWATISTTSAFNALVPGYLYALNPTDLSILYSDPTSFGNVSQFAVPTVVTNGLIYVPTLSNAVVVYGLAGPTLTSQARGHLTMRGKARLR